MPVKSTESYDTLAKTSVQEEISLLPFIVAGVICFGLAVLLGAGSWYFFGSNKKKNPDYGNSAKVFDDEQSRKLSNSETNLEIQQSKLPNNKPEMDGLVAVTGSEVNLGGGESNQPVERVLVNDFFILETEVTNLQYSQFIKETDYRPPQNWKKNTFPKDSENFPVTNVSYKDAEAFCQWLSKKMGVVARLPTEAEWELAARGTQNNKYPWGNDWDTNNSASKETGGKISPIKSFPGNRSPFGAYDMVGNVWEWTQDIVSKDDVVSDEAVQKALNEGQTLRIVKGGSAMVSYKELSAQARYEIPENTKVPVVGFRYVVENKAKN